MVNKRYLMYIVLALFFTILSSYIGYAQTILPPEYSFSCDKA